MKVCPACRIQYCDELRFCKRDGKELLGQEKTGYCKNCKSRYPLGLEKCPLHGQPLLSGGPHIVTGLNSCPICSIDYPREFKLCPLHGVVLQNVREPSRDTTELNHAAIPDRTAVEDASLMLPAGTHGAPNDPAIEAEVSLRELSLDDHDLPSGVELPKTVRPAVQQTHTKEEPLKELFSSLGPESAGSILRRVVGPALVGTVATIVLVAFAFVRPSRSGNPVPDGPSVQPSIGPAEPLKTATFAPALASQPFAITKTATRLPTPSRPRSMPSGEGRGVLVPITEDTVRPIDLQGVNAPVGQSPAPVSSTDKRIPVTAAVSSAAPAAMLPPSVVDSGSADGARITVTLLNRRCSALLHGFRYEFDVLLREHNGVAVGSRGATLRWVSDSGTSGKSRIAAPESFPAFSSETYHMTIELMGTAEEFWRGIAHYEQAGVDAAGKTIRVSLALRLDENFARTSDAAFPHD